MTENDKIKDLENQAANTKNLMDRLNKALYGMSWEEYTRLMGRASDEREQNR